eukprot:scaffold153397_cov37-Prasinocladus_malaysianus.AAC.1
MSVPPWHPTNSCLAVTLSSDHFSSAPMQADRKSKLHQLSRAMEERISYAEAAVESLAADISAAFSAVDSAWTSLGGQLSHLTEHPIQTLLEALHEEATASARDISALNTQLKQQQRKPTVPKDNDETIIGAAGHIIASAPHRSVNNIQEESDIGQSHTTSSIQPVVGPHAVADETSGNILRSTGRSPICSSSQSQAETLSESSRQKPQVTCQSLPRPQNGEGNCHQQESHLAVGLVAQPSQDSESVSFDVSASKQADQTPTESDKHPASPIADIKD